MSDNFLFVFLTFSIGIITISSILLAYQRSRDPFHPLVYIGLILCLTYFYIPWNLYSSNLADLNYYLSADQRTFVQLLNLIGVISLIVGILSGDGKINYKAYQYGYQSSLILPPKARKQFERAAIFFGLLGVVAYLYGIINAGGFTAAYGHSYGGGWSSSGYIREAVHWTLPALIWLMTTRVDQKLSKRDWMWIALFTFPLLTQGLLGARRGPTAIILIVLIMGWYLIHRRRPSLNKLLVGAIALGMLLLFLVVNRSEIYLGSDFNFTWKLDEEAYSTNVTSGNEFIYGSGVILNARQNNDYHWGGRYFTNLFIRPIPRGLWPTQYADAAKWFNIPNLEETNAGTLGETWTLEWRPPRGAATGIIADFWLEFWWYYPIPLYLLGWFYGMAWRKAITQGQLWIPIYTIAAALSVYLIQGFGAIAFRFMLMGFALWMIWLYGKRALPGKRAFNQLH